MEYKLSEMDQATYAYDNLRRDWVAERENVLRELLTRYGMLQFNRRYYLVPTGHADFHAAYPLGISTMSFNDIYLLGNEYIFDGIICWATRRVDFNHPYVYNEE